MAFRVGQEVECIHDEGQICAPFVKKGSIYTISGMHWRTFIGECLEFTELPVTKDVPEYACFPAKYFRPVVRKKTDISLFTAMLNDTKVKA